MSRKIITNDQLFEALAMSGILLMLKLLHDLENSGIISHQDYIDAEYRVLNQMKELPSGEENDRPTMPTQTKPNT